MMTVAAGDFPKFVEALLPAFLAAGRLLEDYRRAGVAAERKSDGSPVSEADREAEALLLDALADLAPDTPCVAEEAVAAGTVPEVRDACFYVDALDGTRGFLKGSKEYTLNVAMVVASKPVFGMVYAPAFGRIFATLAPDEAIGAMLPPGETMTRLTSLAARPIVTRRPATPPLRVLASTSSNRRLQADLLAHYPGVTTAYMSSSLKFCLIACGEADLYPRFGPTGHWDTAAGQAILVAAGGLVTTMDGTPLGYPTDRPGFLNPPFIAWGDPTLIERHPLAV